MKIICDKVGYHTKSLAKNANTGISSKGHDSMKVYKCKRCGLFHLATSGKSKTKKTLWMKHPKYPLKIEDIHYHIDEKIKKRRKRSITK